MTKKTYRSALVIIGNEILSGRTQDANTYHIAQKLGQFGIRLSEVRVIPDIEDKIVKTVQELSEEFDYVFTTGGIGPTHDDITAESIAKAFDVSLEDNKEAYQILFDYYGEADLNDARLKMAKIPEGAGLIENSVSGAPGFHIGNVYVMAGVPKIMQAMIDSVLPTLEGGAPVLSNTVTCSLPESEIAQDLMALQNEYPDVDIGSYPNFRSGVSTLSIVMRSTEEEVLKAVTLSVVDIIRKNGAEPKAMSFMAPVEIF